MKFKIGDKVSAYNEKTREVITGKIIVIIKNPQPYLVQFSNDFICGHNGFIGHHLHNTTEGEFPPKDSRNCWYYAEKELTLFQEALPATESELVPGRWYTSSNWSSKSFIQFSHLSNGNIHGYASCIGNNKVTLKDNAWFHDKGTLKEATQEEICLTLRELKYPLEPKYDMQKAQSLSNTPYTPASICFPPNQEAFKEEKIKLHVVPKIKIFDRNK